LITGSWQGVRISWNTWGRWLYWLSNLPLAISLFLSIHHERWLALVVYQQWCDYGQDKQQSAQNAADDSDEVDFYDADDDARLAQEAALGLID
jgi:hypothetical protein